MRIKSILAVFISGLALSLTACGTEAVQVPESEPAAAEAQAPVEEQALVGICPLKWTCNYQNYYTTQTQCAAACGGDTCSRDYACTGTCVCP